MAFLLNRNQIILDKLCGLIDFIKFEKRSVSKLAFQFKEVKPKSCYPKREPLNRIVCDDKSKSNTQLVDLKNYYQVLGLNEKVSINDIKRAYYILAKKYHPDRYGSTTSIDFQKISEAYNVLSDDVKRSEYDKLGIDYKNSKWPNQPRPIASTHFKVNEQTKKLHEMLRESEKKICVDTHEKVPTPPPACFNSGETEILVTFLEAVQGANKNVSVKSFATCNICNGGTSKIGAPKTLTMCNKCNGLGHQQIITKGKKSTKMCTECKGKKYISTYDCNVCQNRGYKIIENKINVHIMPGTKSNDKLLVQHPIENRHCKICVKVMKSNHFKRVGNDIFTEKELTLTEAVLGGVFKLRGIYNDIKVTVDPGTENLATKRLQGLGVKTKTGTGDHIVTFKVKMPKTLTTKQRSLLQMLQKIEKSFDA